jgi:DNA helicase II / ATP-dependent DNA helicase PcrA
MKEVPLDTVKRQFNDAQQRAITTTQGPLLLVAGAGTGKTTVLTNKIIYLFDHKIASPDNVLALTFSNKAATEMEERVEALLPLGFAELWIHTFHAFCERMLREHALDIGLDPRFELMTEIDAWLFVRKHLFEFELDYYRPLGNPTRFIGNLLTHFSRAKDEDVSVADYLSYAEACVQKAITEEDQIEANRVMEVAKSYEVYERLMVEHGKLDFGGLIMWTIKLFRDRPQILKRYQQQFTHILVDEFQDTNFAQYELVKMLALPQNNLTVTGDDNQSIYKFRGASVSNILQFKDDFPDADQVVLTENYRSTQSILDVAYQSIQQNDPDTLEVKLGITKQLVSNSEHEAVKPRIIQLEDNNQEVRFVLAEIMKARQHIPDLKWKDFAILVRANAHAAPFIDFFQQSKVPYRFVASRGLYSAPDIKDLLAFLRLICDPLDNISMYRYLNFSCFGIERVDIPKLMYLARKNGVSYFDQLSKVRGMVGFGAKSLEGFAQADRIIREHIELATKRSVGEVLVSFFEQSGYLKALKKDTSVLFEERELLIAQFFSKIQELTETKRGQSVGEFLDELDLMIEAGDDPAPIQIDEGPDAIQIMTIHQSKGLEFPYVFVVNMIERRFPTNRRNESIPLPGALIKDVLPQGDAHIQEERRLFYVAMTRAKQALYLTAAKRYGGAREAKLSRFLFEIGAKEDVEHSRMKEMESFADRHGLTLVGSKEEDVRVVKTSRRPIYTLPQKLSYTQLVAFENCPYQYRFAHILKIPSRGSHTFSYGRSMHSTLQEFYRRSLAGTIPSRAELLKLYDKLWIGEWYSDKHHEEKQRAQGREALLHFYDHNDVAAQRPRFLEQRFTLRVGQYRLIGSIDRVDELADGSFEVIDYKTGKMSKSRKQLERDIRKDKQLAIYGLALKQVFNLNPSKLTFYFLDRKESISTEVDHDFLLRVEEEIIELADSMRESAFEATPNQYLCQFCDYKSICEHAVT